MLLKDLVHVGRHLLRRPVRQPQFEGAKPTLRRVLNLHLLTWEWFRRETRLRSLPARLCIESTGACNLRCPHCFTGAGEVGQPRSAVSLELYRRLLAELGPSLWQIELHNWGEPLLNKNTVTMIAEADALGISTCLCTNFSIPFDEARAEQLIDSGLKLLGVSIDGARQETYEQYRVGGNLETVLRNCRLIRDTKRRLGRRTPRMNWSFHLFPHNLGDVEEAGALARELEMDFHVARGRVFGADWDPEEQWIAHEHVEPVPCFTLWHTAVVHSDGGIAPCRGSFYRQDDLGHLKGDDGRAPSFRAEWNSDSFQLARRFFSRRTGTSDEQRHICFDCPASNDFEGYLSHIIAGGSRDDWRPRFDSNQRYNYFWNRRLHHSAGLAAKRSAA